MSASSSTKSTASVETLKKAGMPAFLTALITAQTLLLNNGSLTPPSQNVARNASGDAIYGAGAAADITDVDATDITPYVNLAGRLPVDVVAWNGVAVATPDANGYPVVTIKDGTGQGELNITSGATDANVEKWNTANVASTVSGYPDVNVTHWDDVEQSGGLYDYPRVDVRVVQGVNCGSYVGANFSQFFNVTPTTSNTVDNVGDFSGTVDANVVQWNSTNVPTPDTAGYPKVTIKDGTGQGELDITSGTVDANAVSLLGTAITANAPGAINYFYNVASPSTTIDDVGSGGGGDATASNQTTIITHLTDIKGATWSGTTDTLEDIYDYITARTLASASYFDPAADDVTVGAWETADTVTVGGFSAGAIDAAAIDADAITNTTFAAGAITNTVLATDCIGEDELGTNALTSDQLSTTWVNEIRDAIIDGGVPIDTNNFGHIENVNVLSISGSTTAANNLEAACDGVTGYGFTNCTMPTVTSVTNAVNVDRINGTTLDADFDENINAFYGPTATTSKTVNDVGGSGGDATASNQTTIIDHLTDIKGSTWSDTTDTLEDIRDRGDIAWITATSVNASQVGGSSTAANNMLTAYTGGSYNVGGGGIVASSVTGSVGSISGVGFPTNFSSLEIDGSGRVDVGDILGTAVTANLPGAFNYFFNEAAPSRTMEDVGTGGGGDATEAKQDTIITHLTGIKGATWSGTTDTLEGIHDDIAALHDFDPANDTVATVTSVTNEVTADVSKIEGSAVLSTVAGTLDVNLTHIEDHPLAGSGTYVADGFEAFFNVASPTFNSGTALSNFKATGFSTFDETTDKVYLGNGAHGGAAATLTLSDYSSFKDGGGDATASNQTTIINHLTDIKGATWSGASDTLEYIHDDIAALHDFDPDNDAVATVTSVTNEVTADVSKIEGVAVLSTVAGALDVNLTHIDDHELIGTTTQIADRFQDFFNVASATFNSGTALSSFKATGFAEPGDQMALVNDAITSGKYDETTAYPIILADTGSNKIARTGADSDTLETLSDQIDGVGGGGGDATASNQTTIINHLTDIKGATWSGTTDTLEDIYDYITARTIASASYFDPAADTVATVTSVTNEVTADVSKIEGTAVLSTVAGTLDVNLVYIEDHELAGTTTQIADAFEYFFNIASPDTTINSIPTTAEITSSVGSDLETDHGTGSWQTGGGSANPVMILDTTVSSVTSQVEFKLTAGSTNDDTYNSMTVVFYDGSDSDYPSVRTVTDYDWNSPDRVLVIDVAPDFTVVATDVVKVFANTSRLLDTEGAVDDTATVREALQYISAVLAGKVSGVGTGTETFKGLDGSTDRVEVTVDAEGNRTTVSYD